MMPEDAFGLLRAAWPGVNLGWLGHAPVLSEGSEATNRVLSSHARWSRCDPRMALLKL